MEEAAERGDCSAVAAPGRGSVADDQRGAERFRSRVAGVVAAQPVQRKPCMRRVCDDLVLAWPAGRHADQGVTAGGDAGDLEYRGAAGERRGEQVAPLAVEPAHLADVAV